MPAGLSSSEVSTPNRVDGHSTFMPSAPPVTPRERDAVRKAIWPTASVSMPGDAGHAHDDEADHEGEA